MTSLKLTLYYADWCGHCKTFKSAWKEIKNALTRIGNEYKGVRITAEEYEEGALKTGGKINGKDIQGFPTLKFGLTLGRNRKEYEYNKQRDSDVVLTYVERVADGLAAAASQKNISREYVKRVADGLAAAAAQKNISRE